MNYIDCRVGRVLPSNDFRPNGKREAGRVCYAKNTKGHSPCKPIFEYTETSSLICFKRTNTEKMKIDGLVVQLKQFLSVTN